MIRNPPPRLEVDAHPNVIEYGLSFYSDPLTSLSHFLSTISDGCSFAIAWILAVLINQGKACKLNATMSYVEGSLITMFAWLTMNNLRVGAIFLYSWVAETNVDPDLINFEILGSLLWILAWRNFYTFIFRKFIGMK